MTPELRAYYWIGQALDKYADGPLSPECERVRLGYHVLRIKARRALRLELNARNRLRAQQPAQVLPSLESFLAAPERTSIHAAPCGLGGSWSAHHSKGPGREPDIKGYAASIPGPPRAAAPRQAVLPSSLAYASSSPPAPDTRAQQRLDEDLAAEELLRQWTQPEHPKRKPRWVPLR